MAVFQIWGRVGEHQFAIHLLEYDVLKPVFVIGLWVVVPEESTPALLPFEGPDEMQFGGPDEVVRLYCPGPAETIICAQTIRCISEAADFQETSFQ
ncbi:MAG: hypothetical protein QF638_01130, partial [Acidimicrobiales bacterium]|nr:hypothetical protein [Acidimicrobiales bacterium]